MDSIEIPGVGRGFLVNGLVAVRETAGGIGSRPAESLTADSIVADGIYLATEEEAAMLAQADGPAPEPAAEDAAPEEQPPDSQE